MESGRGGPQSFFGDCCDIRDARNTRDRLSKESRQKGGVFRPSRNQNYILQMIVGNPPLACLSACCLV